MTEILQVSEFRKDLRSTQGNGASIFRIVLYSTLHFMTYEKYLCWILDNYPAMGTGHVVDLLAGSIAGGTAVLFAYSLDFSSNQACLSGYESMLVQVICFLQRQCPDLNQKYFNCSGSFKKAFRPT
ncbi:hypothetical protein MKW98_006591 [Papaver atlanticum]|uniref:Uncharacterized protein n=1 Tax=Papaver atlanticum TaxID=357466 RepID=A0AAD4T9H8_9MAGN|nr:hypothetical protein MKW98_006591 [Papaver atlanticum]